MDTNSYRPRVKKVYPAQVVLLVGIIFALMAIPMIMFVVIINVDFSHVHARKKIGKPIGAPSHHLVMRGIMSTAALNSARK
jgi:hypothetical protein